MSDDDRFDNPDVPDDRQEVLDHLTISGRAYAQMLRRCLDHARLPRPPQADQPWVCFGPRNLGGRIISLAQDPGVPGTVYAGSAHGGLWRSFDNGDTWAHLGGAEFNMPVGALAVHPQRPGHLLVGTGSLDPGHASGIGFFRVAVTAHDDSADFQRLAVAPPPDQPPANAASGDALRYTRIEFDPDDADRFWVASQTGLWRCVLPAATPAAPVWTREVLPAVPAPLSTALATTVPASANPSWPSYATDLRVARDPRSALTVALNGQQVPRYLVLVVGVFGVGVLRGVYDRNTATIAWDPLLPVPNPALGNPISRVLLALCRADPRHVYAVFGNATGAGVAENNHASFVYHSADTGTSWATTATGRIPRAFGYADDPANAVLNAGQAGYSMVLECHPTSPQVVACGEIDLCLSTDSAATWTPILEWQNYDDGDYAQHADQHVAMFDRHDRRRLWAGNDGGLAVAADLTRLPASPGFWRKRSHGIVLGQFQDVTTHSSAALAFMSAGGLQDNGSWLSYGGQTWYHISGGDGGPLVVHAGNPRQFPLSIQNLLAISTVAAGPPVLYVNPVVHEVPAPLASMFLSQRNGRRNGPFVPALEQNPLVPGQLLVGWRRGAGVVSAALAVAAPVGIAAGVATDIALPAPALDAGVEGTAVAFGPGGGAVVEGWVGTSVGRIFHCNQAPNAAPWTEVPALPLPAGVRHAVTRIAVHPTNAAMVAVAVLPADRRLQIDITTGGAPGPAGPARYRVAFANPGGWGPWSLPVPMPAGPFVQAGTTIVLNFTAAAYTAGHGFSVSSDNNVAPVNGAPAVGALSAQSLAAAPITITIRAAGVVGTATFSFTVAGLPASAPPLRTGAAVEVGATGVVLGFAGGPFVANHTWQINTDNTVVPGGGAVGTVEVLGRLHGRVYLSHDRGLRWMDISFPRTRPVPTAALPNLAADSATLSPGPLTSLRFETGGAGIDLYAGTLAGVYRCTGLPAAAPAAPATVDTAWRPFNGTVGHELPLTLVNDVEQIAGSRRLRVATFGRGIWDVDLAGAPRHRLLVRQTLLEDGFSYPRPFPLPIPDDPRLPAGQVWLDHAHAADIRVDTAPFEFFDDRIDGVEFDERLGVDDLQPLAQQAVYVQVHNHGWDRIDQVRVHLFFAPAGVAGPVPTVPAPIPGTSMPAGLPDPIALVAAADFEPAAAGPWQRVGPPQVVSLAPWEPLVLRFDWRPPPSLAVAAPNDYAALLVLCTAVDDPLPTPLPAGSTLASFIAGERRAALRLVRVRPAPLPALSIRDGVDDDARDGSVAFVGRSPDLMVVQAQPADPAGVFADLLATRPQDRIRLATTNHVYVRVHNRGLQAADAEVHLWALALDARQTPAFAPVGWVQLSPAAAPFTTVNIRPGTTALAHFSWANPPDPNPGGALKAMALVALIRSADNQDPLPDTAAITTLDAFWSFFGPRFGADNAALRVLPVLA